MCPGIKLGFELLKSICQFFFSFVLMFICFKIIFLYKQMVCTRGLCLDSQTDMIQIFILPFRSRCMHNLSRCKIHYYDKMSLMRCMLKNRVQIGANSTNSIAQLSSRICNLRLHSQSEHLGSLESAGQQGLWFCIYIKLSRDT